MVWTGHWSPIDVIEQNKITAKQAGLVLSDNVNIPI